MRFWRAGLVWFAVCVFGLAVGTAVQTQTSRNRPTLQVGAVRAAAHAAGLAPLSTVPTPRVASLNNYLKPTSAARTAAIRLGKGFFWDTQAGSDGQSCGSCHFHAGADSRSRNQLNPGLKNSHIQPPIFNPSASGNIGPSGYSGGPDYQLVATDFPFHQVDPTDEKNFNTRAVTFDTDDVTSSMGVFHAQFIGIGDGAQDEGDQTTSVDDIFNLENPAPNDPYRNVRRVEPRNTPTMINAVFTHANFWDGRAHNQFNGVSPIGPLDESAAIWVNTGGAGAAPVQRTVRISNSSLASQAVGPPTSNLEMSFFDRPFPLIGRKLLGLRPLGLQLVDPTDGVLGSLSMSPQPGLNTTYEALIRAAFKEELWNGDNVTLPGVGNVTQLEANFTLFWGLAIQMYETTLVSDQTPLDRFLAGDNDALTQEQLQGLLVFINRGQADNPPAVNNAIARAGVPIGVGNCVSCHSGPELTAAAMSSLGKGGRLELIEREDSPLVVNGLLQAGTEEALEDQGFANIGVRPTFEDLGRGADADFPFPLSFSRQALAALSFLLPPGADLPCAPAECPTSVRVDGAFKIPGLRNVALTGPYFHNGGQATLRQVVEFYDRQGDFGDVNIDHLDAEMAGIGLTEDDEDPLVAFLQGLTDERVRNEQAPFDHPALRVPIGGTQGTPLHLDVPAVGSGGLPAKGLPPLKPFLVP